MIKKMKKSDLKPKPVKRKKVVRRSVPMKKSQERRILDSIHSEVLEIQYKMFGEETRRTGALESIASSLRTIAQYAADYATRDRVQRLLTADAGATNVVEPV